MRTAGSKATSTPGTVLRWIFALTAMLAFFGCDSTVETPKPDEELLVARVRGAGEYAFYGTVGDQEGKIRQLKGTVPARYEFGLSDAEGARAVASFTVVRDASNLQDGSFEVELLRSGEVVRRAKSVWDESEVSDSSAENVSVSVFWSRDDPQESEVATVRVTGPEGEDFEGSVGSSHERRSVFGTVPAEYEVSLDSGGKYEKVSATLTSSNNSATGGCDLSVEVIYDGRSVQSHEFEPTATDEPVSEACYLDSLWERPSP